MTSLSLLAGRTVSKAFSSGLILNEFLKYSYSKCKILTAYTRLFNIVFSSGFVLDEWSKGIISSDKSKGDTANPDNYRGITILSCFGKLFTAVLKKYLETMN